MSSSPNKDVFKYELDITDIEQKAQRVLALLDQVQKGRASGANTSGVEAELTKIKAALDALEQKGAKASGGGAAGAGAAAEQAAEKFEKLGSATADAGEELFDFERKGEKLVKGALGALSPQLAGAADMAIDLAEGFTKISPALLGVAGVGAAVGLVTFALQQMSIAARDAQEKLERLSEAQKALREKAVQGQGSFADELLKVGVSGGAQGANEAFMRLTSGGMPQAMAHQVALAGTFAQANGLPFNEQQFAAGLTRAGGQMPGAENAMQFGAVVRQLMSAGGQAGANARLRDYLADRGAATAFENIGTPSATPGMTEVMQDQVNAEKVSRGDITAEPARRTTTFLRNPRLRARTAYVENRMKYLRWLTDALNLTSNDDRIALENAANVERDAAERLGGQSSVGPPTPSAPQRFQPVIIQNVGSQFNGAGNPLNSSFHTGAVGAPGGGMLDVSNGR